MALTTTVSLSQLYGGPERAGGLDYRRARSLSGPREDLPFKWAVVGGHTGAWAPNPAAAMLRQEPSDRAAAAAWHALLEGADVQRAVIEAIKVVDLDVNVIASLGSAPQRDGVIRCDSAFAHGVDGGLNWGAVTGTEGIVHPVEAAAYMADQRENVCGTPGAAWIAEQLGLERRDNALWRQAYEESAEYRWGLRRESGTDTAGFGAVVVRWDGSIEYAMGTCTGGFPDAIPGRQSDASVKDAGFGISSASFGVSMVMFSGRGENNQDISAGRIAEDALWHATLSQNCHGVLGRLLQHGGTSGPSGVIGLRLAYPRGDRSPTVQLVHAMSVDHFPATFLASGGAVVEAVTYARRGDTPVRVHSTPFHAVQDLTLETPPMEPSDNTRAL
ncbi:MAG TPA: isoaspartyl peptidase/L-asparaginase [Candidatus Dormibacteraeota bacterium]|jgi:isoaspartyl peptidase/L-asparaginase-like protein (Ntn-hydrolase superfamily)|nr:isoaspartyl peptidase/L-asparaginase [Candidatus Dormibacteraeota bacterium]